jgi:large subunit ribosomal protein L10
MAKFLKRLIAGEFKELAGEAEDCLLVDFRGLSAKESDELRRRLREHGIRMNVIRNRLYRRAMEQAFLDSAGEEAVTAVLRGPTAVVFGGDGSVTAAKTLVEWRKEHQKLTIKGGFLDRRVLDVEAVETLAALPSREVLLAQVVGVIAEPLRAIVGVLDGATRNLVWALNAIVEKKESATDTGS